ncbi:hypothetical protein [Streptomyces sp. NPDC046979]|uniref:hypothetical protein n=1 Tax=Streptomyces sp. NPDC046979 TaxID=3154604 RepID=UPI0033DD184B
MQTFTSTELNRKSGAILQAAEEQGSVEIRKGSKVYVLQYVRTESEVVTYVRNEPAAVGGDEVVSLLQEQTALLRELVEQGRSQCDSAARSRKPQAAEVVTSGTVTAQVDEGPQRPVVVIPERVEEPKPEPPGEPSPQELRAAQEYFGLQEVPDGLEITQRGIQSALAHMKKASRGKPDSVEAQVISMDPASEGRMECIRLYQIDRYSKALAKRAAGDPRWLGSATPF